MSVELTMLAYSVALLLVLVLIQVVAGIRTQGLTPLANSRDDLPPPGVFQARVGRVVQNHREGLTMMAPLLLMVAVMDASSPLTVLGAQLFFYSRVAHAAVYLAGLPMIRPLIWGVGLAGIVMVLAHLLGFA
jgi:uncharacterized MAPEG superfamily protein